MTSTQPAGEAPATAVPAAPAPLVEAVAEAVPAPVAVAEEAPAQEANVLIAKEPKAVKAVKAVKAPKATKAPKAARKAAPAPASANLTGLPAAVAARIAKQGFSIPEAAGFIGVSAVSLSAVLKGTSNPNSRTLARYLAWVGDSYKAPAPVKAAKAAAPARLPRGRKPAVASSANSTSVKAAFAAIRAALGARPAAPAAPAVKDAISGDKLAVAVHKAPKATRKIIQTLLKAL